MAVLFDAFSGGNNGGGTTISWSHTASGTNRLVVASISANNSMGAISAFTYGGVAMTLYRNDGLIATYYMINPPTGAQTIAVTYANFSFVEGESISVTNAHQTSPIGANGYVTTSAAAISQALSVNAGSLVISSGTTGSIFSSITASGTGQTMRRVAKGNGQCWGMISDQTCPSTASLTGGFASTFFTASWYMHSIEILQAGPSRIPRSGVMDSELMLV